MEAPRERGARGVMRWLRPAVLLLALVFIAAVVLAEWDKIRATAGTFRLDFLALSLVALTVIIFLDAYGWHLVLRALGHELPAHRSMQAWSVSSLARYIPGGVWSYASRVALARAEGVDVATASLSLYLETLLLMASSLAVGSLALLWGVGLPVHPVLAVAICVLPGLALHPRVLALLKKLPGRVGAAMRNVRLPTLRWTLGLYAYYVVFWVLFGAVFVGFAFAVHPVASAHWIPVGAAIALGFFVGFVVIFVPGGIGVRESALYLLLLPFLPPTTSLVVSIGSRLWLMAAEGSALILVVLYGRIRLRGGVRAGMPRR